MLHTNITSEGGSLRFAGQDVTELARRFGTPLYLLDVDRVRQNCRAYTAALSEFAPNGGAAMYASKSLCFTGIYPVIAEERMRADVVSCGEIYTAVRAGFDPALLYFHSNNKTAEDIEYALDAGVGCFVVDNPEELAALNAAAAERGKTQQVLLRVSPGIDPHTFKAVATGQLDSKFGVAIETGDAERFVRAAVDCANVDVLGLHCHIGSQIFDAAPFVDAIAAMTDFISDISLKTGFVCRVLDLGGGVGVRYTDKDPEVDIYTSVRTICIALASACAEKGLDAPFLLLEPGRSISADAGMTLYTVGSIKELPGIRNWVCIDGSMDDNPRYCLYGSEYTVYNASRADESADYVCTVAGRCCESGDMIGEGLSIARPRVGDVLAVAVTGSYNYSMASNYNRLPRPALIMLENGEAKVGIRRETFEDLVACDAEV